MQDLPNLYQLYQLPLNATPVLLNDTAVTIAGEVLWATDGSGALVITEHTRENWEEQPLREIQWVSTTSNVTATLHIRGHYLRWGNKANEYSEFYGDAVATVIIQIQAALASHPHKALMPIIIHH